MVQSLGAQIGLLAFAVAVVAGLWAGNSATVILTRALLAMLAGVLIGQLAGWAGKTILREHFQRKKSQIDRQHLQALRGLAEPGPRDNLPQQSERTV